MKFSWIILFAFGALSLAIGAHSLGIYMESQVRSSQLACMNDQMRKVLVRSSAVQKDRDKLATEIDELAASIKTLELNLAEEKKTNEPLRQQIERMNSQDGALELRLKQSKDEVEKLREELADERGKLSLAAASEEETKRLQDELDAVKAKAETDLKELEANGAKRIEVLKKEIARLLQENKRNQAAVPGAVPNEKQ